MLRQAMTLQRERNFAAAERLCREALMIDPQNYDALHMLGLLALEAGNRERAVELISAAIRVDDSQAAAHYNLGNALRLLKRHEEAIASYDRALALKPDSARAFNNRGNSLWDLKRNAEAVESYSRAVVIDPGFADAWHNRGHALNELKRADEAIESFRRAVAAGGDRARLDFELAALGAGNTPSTAPAQFVASMFDRYADNFDRHLVEDLKYQTPADAVDAVKRLIHSTGLNVLDLGCGTGLCGPLLRPLARSLTGVDLSANMLSKARARQVYDDLVCSDITKYLQTKFSGFDLVITTDVFIYIGDLAAVFAGVRRALKSGGLFAFSVEEGESGDFVLRKTKRYAHTGAYLRRLAGEHGFSVESLEPKFIRKDEDGDIGGLVAVLRLADA